MKIMAATERMRLGAAGLLGVGLICFAISIGLGTVSPMWTAHGRLQLELAALEQNHAGLSRAPNASGGPPLRGGASPSLPTLEEAHVRLQAIQSVGIEEGLGFERASYDIRNGESNRAMLYSIVLPTRASYISVRRFLDRILAANPEIELESLVLQRQQASDPLVEAELRLSLRLASQ